MTEALSVLAVDDSPEALFALEELLRSRGYEVVSAENGKQALEELAKRAFDLVISDIHMPILDGLELTRRLKSDPVLRFTPIVLVTAREDLADVVQGLSEGADDYLKKPFRAEELLARLESAARSRRLYAELRNVSEENRTLRLRLAEEKAFERIIGNSAPMLEVFSLIQRVADADVPVLILGESGTGKELVAKALHERSSRRLRPFIIQNCSAFSETLLESELFGHVRGAFSGAVRDKQGLFEAANGGTFFLDELGEMSPALQAKLLRVLQDGTFTPVGATAQRRVDVRVVAATNRNIRQMIEAKTFREDLFYRLNVVSINLSPLRDRRGDVPLLAEHFLKAACERLHRNERKLTEGAHVALCAYDWPGNVRELKNEMERAVLLSGDVTEISEKMLSPQVCRPSSAPGTAPSNAVNLKEATTALEREMIKRALDECSGNRSEASRRLGISRSNLLSKIAEYGL